jgi:hypothetical protein
LQVEFMPQQLLNHCVKRGCIYVLLHFFTLEHVLQQPCMLACCSSEQQLARLVRL